MLDCYTVQFDFGQQAPSFDTTAHTHELGQVPTGTLQNRLETFSITLNPYFYMCFCIECAEHGQDSDSYSVNEFLTQHLVETGQLTPKTTGADGNYTYVRVSMTNYDFAKNANWRSMAHAVRKMIMQDKIMDRGLLVRFANVTSPVEIVCAIHESIANQQSIHVQASFGLLLKTGKENNATAQSVLSNSADAFRKLVQSTGEMNKEQLLNLVAKIALIQRLLNNNLMHQTIEMMILNEPATLYGTSGNDLTSFDQLVTRLQQYHDRQQGSKSSTDQDKTATIEQLAKDMKKDIKKAISNLETKMTNANSDSDPPSNKKGKGKGKGKRKESSKKRFEEYKNKAKTQKTFERIKELCKKSSVATKDWQTIEKKVLIENKICFKCGMDFLGVHHFSICPKTPSVKALDECSTASSDSVGTTGTVAYSANEIAFDNRESSVQQLTVADGPSDFSKTVLAPWSAVVCSPGSLTDQEVDYYQEVFEQSMVTAACYNSIQDQPGQSLDDISAEEIEQIAKTSDYNTSIVVGGVVLDDDVVEGVPEETVVMADFIESGCACSSDICSCKPAPTIEGLTLSPSSSPPSEFPMTPEPVQSFQAVEIELDGYDGVNDFDRELELSFSDDQWNPFNLELVTPVCFPKPMEECEVDPETVDTYESFWNDVAFTAFGEFWHPDYFVSQLMLYTISYIAMVVNVVNYISPSSTLKFGQHLRSFFSLTSIGRTGRFMRDAWFNGVRTVAPWTHLKIGMSLYVLCIACMGCCIAFLCASSVENMVAASRVDRLPFEFENFTSPTDFRRGGVENSSHTPTTSDEVSY